MRHELYGFIRSLILDKEDRNSFQAENPDRGDALIIPPFLGEMGCEIHFFLGAVEPWLRSGWKILARRPEFYPEGTAVHDANLFAKIDALLKEFSAIASLNQPIISFNPHPVSNASVDFDFNDGFSASLTDPENLNALARRRQFEKSLKKIVGEYILHKKRPSNFWDDYLTNLGSCYGDLFMSVIQKPVLPSYLPPFYEKGPDICGEHIGVQLRNYSDHSRNSDVPRVLALAQKASAILGKPVLIYGHPKGTIQPEGYLSTTAISSEHGMPLLEFELRALRTCTLMFSPLSGWADLMAWLRVPSLIEKVTDSLIIGRLASFRPRLATLNFESDLKHQIDTLLSTETSVALPLSPTAMPHHLSIPSGIFNRSFY